MFKKFCIFMAAVFTMLISCAGPIMTRVHAADDFPTTLEDLKIKNESPALVDNCHYAFANTYSTVNNEVKTGAILVRLNDIYLNDIYCEYSNNIFILRSNNGDPLFEFFVFYDSWGIHSYTRSASAVQFDFNDNVVYALDSDLNYIRLSGYDSNITSCQFGNFDTNFEEYAPNENSLSLDVSFKPTLSGIISRKQTIDGKEYTSTTLDMYISNNGSDAQFAMFIVPSGGSVTFPSTNLNNSGFNPEGVVYAYIADEWSTFNYGFVGSQIQAPCTWHSVPSGYTNQLYSIPWNQMDLTANTNYDCVVYACLNDDMTQINNVSNGWNMRGTFSVTSNLNDVQEIYRSSFSITDPATFNPDSINESGASHSWNQNTDNNALFNSSSAYRDDNGNIVIRGQTSGGNNVLTSFWDNSNFSINGMFGQYFMFLNGVFMFFPSPWQAIFTCGLITLVIIGIIKAVT